MMLTVLLWAAVMAAVPPLVLLAARRAAAQPFPICADDERLLLAGARHAWRTDAEDLTAAMFTDPGRARAWQSFLDGRSEGGDHSIGHGQWLVAGGRVIAAAEDRALLSGRGLVTALPDGTSHRLPTPVTAARIGMSLLLTALTGTTAVLSGWALPTQLAVAVLAAAGLIITLVDWDTLYIDLPAAGIATAAAAGAVLTSPDPQRWMLMWPGLAVVAMLLVVLLAHRLVREQWGMAFGDVLLMPAFLIAPAGWTGHPGIGMAALMAALVTSLLGYLLTHRRHGASVPFAFGPYLVYGWVFAAGWYTVSGMLAGGL